MNVTNEMVKYWIGGKRRDAIKVIREIANSYNDKQPWTPNILNQDIRQTWKTKKEKK